MSVHCPLMFNLFSRSSTTPALTKLHLDIHRRSRVMSFDDSSGNARPPPSSGFIDNNNNGEGGDDGEREQPVPIEAEAPRQLPVQRNLNTELNISDSNSEENLKDLEGYLKKDFQDFQQRYIIEEPSTGSRDCSQSTSAITTTTAATSESTIISTSSSQSQKRKFSSETTNITSQSNMTGKCFLSFLLSLFLFIYFSCLTLTFYL